MYIYIYICIWVAVRIMSRVPKKGPTFGQPPICIGRCGDFSGYTRDGRKHVGGQIGIYKVCRIIWGYVEGWMYRDIMCIGHRGLEV